MLEVPGVAGPGGQPRGRVEVDGVVPGRLQRLPGDGRAPDLVEARAALARPALVLDFDDRERVRRPARVRRRQVFRAVDRERPGRVRPRRGGAEGGGAEEVALGVLAVGGLRHGPPRERRGPGPRHGEVHGAHGLVVRDEVAVNDPQLDVRVAVPGDPGLERLAPLGIEVLRRDGRFSDDGPVDDDDDVGVRPAAARQEAPVLGDERAGSHDVHAERGHNVGGFAVFGVASMRAAW
mmetsp:Transcript_20608/g.67398  ORF Transcript_20608/g.67398 Transcript_20608/m.67398 type:complete len:236 (+) Transcript_20608:1304-2011(+)